MRRKVLSKGKAIQSFRICGVICIFLLIAVCNAYPIAITEVTVNESLGGYHNLHIEGVSSSSAYLSYLFGSAWAEVDIAHGTLKTFVQTSTSDVLTAQGASVNAWATFVDYFTLSGLPQGTVVWITANLHLTGNIYTTPAQSYVAYSGGGGSMTWDTGVAGFLFDNLWSWPEGGEMSVDTVCSGVIPVYPDEPFRVVLDLSSWGQGWNHYDILSDFSSTATLSFDLPDGTWISSEGGFSQSSSPAIPEPATMLLLGSGLLGLWGARKKFKK